MRSLLLLAALAVPAPAATYYVATDGSDENPGTLEKPFLTVQKGADAAYSPGDTTYVRGGTYETRERVFLRRSGKPGLPVTLAAYPGEKPVIRFLEPSSGETPRLEIQNPARGPAPIGWVTVEGLELAGGYDGIKFYNAHDLTIRGCVIRDSQRQGILGVGGFRVVIASNTILRSGDAAAVAGASVGNKLHGLYATGTEYEIVDNVFDGSLAWGVQAAGYPFDEKSYAGLEYAGASRWRIARNLFARGVHHGGVVVWLPDARDIVIENNVFYGNARAASPGKAMGIDFNRSGGGHVVAGNVFWSTGPAAGLPAIVDSAGGKSYVETGSRRVDQGEGAAHGL